MTDSMLPTTHACISPTLVGRPLSLEPGKAVVELVTLESMVADPQGLVHGGFIFGLADYAAMLAVNEPTVVLGASQNRFLAPVRAGDVAVATAVVVTTEKNRHQVECMVKVNDKPVFTGEFTCFVLEKHVLD